ncbi:hypothetical protein HLB15_13630 [Promicromonospora citrea]|uniref:hypothetical protein n=1 Tax=Promicromonospora citrea TaxID=43677 RepID=UPI001488DDA3|nr:hypothetical protein [Promicromonospora citrea]NNH53283.1 hypothetical protein [Promicromonospora citrea]
MALEGTGVRPGGPAITAEFAPGTLQVVRPELLPATDPTMLVLQHNPHAWSWANATHENYWDKADAMKSRGVTMAARAGDLVPGDKVSLGPLLLQLSQDERYTIDADAARTTMAEVDQVLHRHFRSSGSSYAWISTDQGQFTLAFDAPVSFLPGRSERCERCGSHMPGSECTGGLCATCEDLAEAVGELH